MSGQNSLAPFSEIPPRVFETERLRLRALTLADLALIFETYTGDVIATKYMAWPRVLAPEEGRPFVEMVVASFAGTPTGSAQFSWLIQLKGSGRYIGGCGIGADSPTSVGGGYILNPRYWGQGYAAEAFRPVVDWARAQPNVQRIEATHHPDNPASGGVMRKVGLSFARINHAPNGYPNLDQPTAEELVYAWVRSSQNDSL
ncbi:MAG: hypothetical protein RL518_1041 [Pseudomonadota bacterium]